MMPPPASRGRHDPVIHVGARERAAARQANEGTSANGIPNDNTTCEMTSALVGSTPMINTTRAGMRVTSRRTSSG